jgi:addiction module HigA family antidote
MATTERNEHIEDNEFLTDLYPPHPGQLLKTEVLPARKVTGTALAKAIGATQPSVAKVLNGKGPVTPGLAARIEAAIGYPAAILCRLQTAYDLAEVRRENSERLSAIPRIAKAA